MPNVKMPDGAIVAFPDDMPPEKIKELISSKFPDATKTADEAQRDKLRSIAGAAYKGGDVLPSAETVIRQTATLPIGAVQATKAGIEALGAQPNAFDKQFDEAAANVTKETNRQTAETPLGVATQIGTEVLQLPLGPAKWVSEGMGTFGRLATNTVQNAGIGAGAGAVQPVDTTDPSLAAEQRNKNMLYGGAIAAGISGLGGAALMGAKGIYQRVSSHAAGRKLAGELQTKLDPIAQSAQGNSAPSIMAKEAADKLDKATALENSLPLQLNADGTPIQYKANTNAVLNAPELDSINTEGNSNRVQNTLEEGSKREIANKQYVDATQKAQVNTNATFENVNKEAQKSLADALEGSNSVTDAVTKQTKKIVDADPNLTPMQANKIAGDYISTMFEASDNKVRQLYDSIPDVPVDATDLSQAVTDAAKDVPKRYFKDLGNVKKLIQSDAEELPTGKFDLTGKPVMAKPDAEPVEMSAQEISKANAELANVMTKAYNEKNFDAYDALKDIKDNIRNFLESHPDSAIADPANEAAAFTKEYRADTLRRGSLKDPGVGQDIRKLKNNSNVVQNESMLRQNFLGRGNEAPIETVEDFKRLVKHHADNFDSTAMSTAEKNERQALYSDLNERMQGIIEGTDKPDAGKFDTFMKNNASSFEAFPQLRQEFQQLGDSIAANQPKYAVAKILKNPNKTADNYTQIFSNPEMMANAVDIVSKNPAAREELKDGFKQFLYNKGAKGNKTGANDIPHEFFVPDTDKNRALLELYKGDSKGLKQLELVDYLTMQNKGDTTFSAGAKVDQAIKDKEMAAKGSASVLLSTGLSKFDAVWKPIANFTNKGRVAVIDKFRTDKEFASQILRMDLSKPGAQEKLYDVLIKAAQEKSAVPAAAAYGANKKKR